MIHVQWEIKDGKLQKSCRLPKGMTRENGLVTQGVRRLYIYQFLGVNLISPDNDTSESILNSTEYQTMSLYPAAGSIQKISGCWVVKLSD